MHGFRSIRLFGLTPLGVVAAVWLLSWAIPSSLPALLLCGAAVSGLLAAAQEVHRRQWPVRVGLAAAGAGAMFFLIAVALLLLSFSTVDSDQMR